MTSFHGHPSPFHSENTSLKHLGGQQYPLPIRSCCCYLNNMYNIFQTSSYIYIYPTDLSHLQHPQHPHPNPISTPIPTPSPHLLGDGHLIKGRQRGKHRAADPRREAALGIAHHLHLQRPRGLPGGDVKGKRLEQQGKVWMDLGRTRYMDDDGKIDLGRTMDS